MSLFDWFRRPKASPLTGYAISEDDRDKAMQIRQQTLELRKLAFEKKKTEMELQKLSSQAELMEMQARVEELRASLEPYDDDDDDESKSDIEQFASIIGAVMAAKSAPAQQVTEQVMVSSPNTAQYVTFSDEEIKQFINTIPRVQRKLGKSMSDDTLRKLIRSRVPSISPETEVRAVELFRQS